MVKYKEWQAGMQFNVHIGKDDVNTMNEFEKLINDTRRDRSKTIKFLIERYVNVMKQEIGELNGIVEKEIRLHSDLPGAYAKRKQINNND